VTETRINFRTRNKTQNNLPGTTTYFGVLQQLMTLVICGTEYGAVLGRSVEYVCSGMQRTLALRFNKKHVNLPAVS
jgi:hypothetical protein